MIVISRPLWRDNLLVLSFNNCINHQARNINFSVMR